MTLKDRFTRLWNAFANKDPTPINYPIGMSYSLNPSRIQFTGGNDKTIISSVMNRIAVDVASFSILHGLLNEDGIFKDSIDSSLNYCLNTSANIDQAGTAFRLDVAASLLDEGVIAVFPVDINIDDDTGKRSILSLRTGKVIQWFPDQVLIEAYNELSGQREQIYCKKSTTALIENPFYAVMNETNSTAKRLNRKLVLLDKIDEMQGSNKLDLILQLPYSLRNELRREEAKERLQYLNEQLSNSELGIGYIDSTEKITQLNRPVENQLLSQVEYLTSMLLSQLSITKEILEGTADEKTMNNYYYRTVEPIVNAIAEEFKRKFISEDEIKNGETIYYYRDPFKFTSAAEIASMSDSLTRNEILTSNEIRSKLGFKPSSSPNADELRNKNMPIEKTSMESITNNINEENNEGGNEIGR